MFTPNEINLLRDIGLEYNFEKMSDDEWCIVQEVVGDYLTMHGFTQSGKPNNEGILCERILDKLGNN